MGSIPPVNPGVSDLLQTLSNSGLTSVSSTLSTPAVQTALENASPGDIVSLSAEAVQLQEATGLFPSADSTQTAASIILQALNNSKSGSTANGASTPAATTPAASAAATAATAAQASELEQVSELFGTNSNAGTGNEPLSFIG
jgi:hypothetical protein